VVPYSALVLRGRLVSGALRGGSPPPPSPKAVVCCKACQTLGLRVKVAFKPG
jgi:hypothetical protein